MATPRAGRRHRHAAWNVAAAAAVGLLICTDGGGGVASAAVVEFSNDLSGFTAAAGNSDVEASFDDIAAGTDIGGKKIGEATFNAIGSPLIVVDASTTVSGGGSVIPAGPANKLAATSGANVLSPGGGVLGVGPDDAIENDDVQLVFDNPVGYVGVDHLSQRADGQGFTRVEVFGTGGETLLDTIIPISNLPAGEDGLIPGGNDFWGVVSDGNDIKSMTFDEVDSDDTAPDNNVGYDSFRFGTLADDSGGGGGGGGGDGVSIPLPAATMTMPMLLGFAEIVRRRMRI